MRNLLLIATKLPSVGKHYSKTKDPLEHCKEFIWAWNKLTAHQTNVCLNGDGGGGGFHQDEIDGKYKLWTWEKFKTKSGCYSYFAG